MDFRIRNLIKSSSEPLWHWVVLLFSYASGGPTTAFALWYILTAQEPPKNGLITILGVMAVVASMVVAYKERALRISLLERHLPRLTAREGEFHVFLGEGEYQDTFKKKRYSYSSLRLNLTNDPEFTSPDSQALQVAARISMFRENSNELLYEYQGRWCESVEPSRLANNETPATLKTMDIPVNTSQKLDIVVKNERTPQLLLDMSNTERGMYDRQRYSCFAINNESYRFFLLENPAWELLPGVYRALVSVRSANINQQFELTFENPEGDAPLKPIACKEVTKKNYSSII